MSRKLALSVMLAMLVAGCGLGSANTRTVVVPLGEPIILLNAIPGKFKVLAADAEGVWVESFVEEIPQGWACLAPTSSDFE